MARALAAPELEYGVWIAYPHQNLAALEGVLEDPEEWLAAAARLLGSSGAEVPRFGPFRLPPSHSMTIAAGGEGRRGLVVVDVYPGLSIVARLAGKLAGNPLLSGGSVELGGEPFVVSWRDGHWILESRGSAVELPEKGEDLPPSLGWLAIDATGAPLPKGRYRMIREGADFLLSSKKTPGAGGASRDLAQALEARLGEQLAFFGLEGVGGRDTNLLFVLADSSPGGASLPDSAVLHRPNGERWTLPAESLERILSLDFQRFASGGWLVVASSERAGRAALEAAALLDEALLDAALPDEALPAALETAIRIRPDVAAPVISPVRELLEAVPFAHDELRRWRDYGIVLAPLLDREVVSLEVGSGSAGAELRLSGALP